MDSDSQFLNMIKNAYFYRAISMLMSCQ